MKNKIFYTLLAAAALVVMPACNEDYEDATSIHVYGPDENPPVKDDTSLMPSQSYEMIGGQEEPVVMHINDYAANIQAALGVTVDELMDKLGTEYEVVPVNPNRMAWVKTPANAGDNYAWYMSKTANVCNGDDETLYGILKFNKAERQFEFYIDPKAGGSVAMQIGFVKLGKPNYNEAVRFQMAVTAFDNSFIFMDMLIPAGDYAAEVIDVADIADNINYVFGMTPAQFVAAYDSQIGMYMVSKETNAPVWDGESTANAGGYWCNADNEIMGWGAGCAYYIEPWFGDEEGDMIAIGRYPGWDPGNVFDVRFAFADKNDRSKVLTFIVTATFE